MAYYMICSFKHLYSLVSSLRILGFYTVWMSENSSSIDVPYGFIFLLFGGLGLSRLCTRW